MDDENDGKDDDEDFKNDEDDFESDDADGNNKDADEDDSREEVVKIQPGQSDEGEQEDKTPVRMRVMNLEMKVIQLTII